MKQILSLILLAAIPTACVDRTRSLEEMSLRQLTDRSEADAEQSKKSVEAIAAINAQMQTTAAAVASNLEDTKRQRPKGR